VKPEEGYVWAIRWSGRLDEQRGRWAAAHSRDRIGGRRIDREGTAGHSYGIHFAKEITRPPASRYEEKRAENGKRSKPLKPCDPSAIKGKVARSIDPDITHTRQKNYPISDYGSSTKEIALQSKRYFIG
jgi:hypothetical protein